MPNNRAELILALRDEISSGMAKVNASLAQTRQAVQDLGAAGKQAGAQHAAGFSDATAKAGSYANQLLAVVGVTASVAGAAYLAQRAYGSWFSLVSQGIGMVDDYQQKIIGTSYIMATTSDVKPPDLSKAYAQWTEYHKWLYQESLRVDKQSAASSQEILSIALELEKKGVVANTHEKMEIVGRLTDLMKGVIPTYASLQEQARGEIEAVMEGTSRLGAQTAKTLGQIDPAFKENIKSARAAGTEMEYFARILPKIEQYTLDMMGSWNAVGASLKSAWHVINLKAFGDAHREVVGLAQQLGNRLVANGQLTQEGEAAAKALGQTWAAAKTSIAGALDYALNNSDKIIEDAGKIASAAGSIVSAGVTSAQWLVNNANLLKGLGEIFISYKIAQWASSGAAALSTLALAHTSQAAAATAAATATTALTGATVACTAATLEAAIASKGLAAGNYLILANSHGAITGVQTLTTTVSAGAAGARVATIAYGALGTAIGGLVTQITLLAAAGGVYGVYKTLKGEAGYASPDDPYAAMNLDTEAVGGAKPSPPPLVGPPAPTAAELQYQQLQKKIDDMLTAPPTPPVRPFTDPSGKRGGKGAEAAERSLENFTARMHQEIAKGSGEGMAALQAWRQKEIQTLDQLAAKGVDVAEGRKALAAATYAKEAKLAEDFYSLEARESGNAYVEIDRQAQEWLTKFAGIKNKEGQLIDVSARVQAITTRKYAEQQNKDDQEALSRKKDYLDKMAGYAPLLTQQLALQRQILGVEEEQAQKKLDLELITGRITEAEWQQLEAVRAQSAAWASLAQDKQEWATQGAAGGYKTWQADRWQEMETRGATWMKDFLGKMETGMADSLSQGLIDWVEGNQGGLERFRKSMFEWGVKEIITSNVKTVWDALAGQRPAQPIVTGAEQAGQSLVQGGVNCGQRIVSAAEQAASILSAVNLKGSGVGGVGGLGGIEAARGRISAAAASAPGSVGGAGGGGTGADSGEDISKYMAIFARASGNLYQGTLRFTPAVNYLGQTVNPAAYQAAISSQQAATLGMMSNLQLGLGAAGLGLGAIGLLTGSQELAMAGMVLNTAAVALQVAAIIMKATGMIPGAAAGGILAGSFHPIAVARFADGHPFVSQPTLGWVGEGEDPEAVIPLKGGMVPVRFTGKSNTRSNEAQPQPLVYAPTYNFTAMDTAGMDALLKKHLPRHESTVRKMLEDAHRNFKRIRS